MQSKTSDQDPQEPRDDQVDCIEHDNSAAQATMPEVQFVDLQGNRVKATTDGQAPSDQLESSSAGSVEIDEASVSYEEPSAALSFYSFTRFCMKFSMNQFFRDITVLGKHNIPKRGPLIFCGNHSNQFVDGSILFFTAQRDVRFMVAGKSTRRPVLSHFFRWSKSIPVERAQDLAKACKGKITFEDNLTMIGDQDCKFIKDFAVGDSVKILSASDQLQVEDQIVEKIVSDTEILLKKPGAKIYDPNKSYAYKCLPKVDQSTVFKNVEDVLGNGGCVAMFPEGGSHDRADLLPFKAGIALMTFGTIVNTGQIPVVIPSGLKYFKRHEFRSRCVIEYGRPYKPSKKMIDLYKSGEKRKAVALFLKDLEDRMREVVMTAPSYNELQAIYMARNLYLPKRLQSFSPEQENDIYQRFSKGYSMLKEKPEMQQLVESITSYRQMLKLFNISDDQVALFKEQPLVQIFWCVYSFVMLILSLIFAIPGNLITFPLSTAISFYAERERIKALKASAVKIKANDVLSSIKILAYISTFPLYVCLFTFILNRTLRWYFHYDRGETYYWASVFFLLYPIFSLVAIRSHDGVRTHYTDFQGRFLSFFYTGQVELIQSARKQLKKKVRETVDKVGPQIYKNFDKMRLIMFDPTISESNSRRGSRPSKTKRSSSATKVDRLANSEMQNQARPRLAKGLANSMIESGDDQQLVQPGSPAKRIESAASSNYKFDTYTKSVTDYDLDYKDELELNRAFNVFKDI